MVGVRRFLTVQFKKYAIYNVLVNLVLACFYLPYNIFWLQYSGLQLAKWFLTAAAFGSVVNLVMRPYVGWITRMLDRRYPAAKPLNSGKAPGMVEED